MFDYHCCCKRYPFLAPLSLQNLWSEVSPCVIFWQIEMFSPYSERNDMFEVWGLIAIPRLSVKTINVYGTKDELSMPVFDKIDWIFQTLVCLKAKRIVLSKYEKRRVVMLVRSSFIWRIVTTHSTMWREQQASHFKS